MKKFYFFCSKTVIAVTIVFIGYFILGRLVRRLVKSIETRVPRELAGILDFILFYGFYLLLVVIVLQTLGVNLSSLVATAGIAGIAIGFAAQTSLSNMISGIILLLEQSFKLGDNISFEGLEGTVEQVGLLAMTLRTPDNRQIRIPNERLIKNSVINVTARSHRMLSFTITVDYRENMEQVQQLLEKVVMDLPYRIDHKPVMVIFWGSSLQPVFSTPNLIQTVYFKVQWWTNVPDINAAKSAFIKACLQAAQEQKPPLLLAIEEK